MCGIFGEFGKIKTSEKEFLFLNDINTRRGPDDKGHWSDESHCRLGFRRLAIIDLSPNGNQPMHSISGRWVMILNGEIYNYRDLYEEIGRPALKSVADTEVAINVFEKFGVTEGAKKLNGMFAIALYDTRQKQLHLIRDFAGIKPLYYGAVNGSVVFGSAYDQVFMHPCFKDARQVNNGALSDYLMLGNIPAPNAFFKNTWQLLPGQIITLSTDGSIQKEIYYTFTGNSAKYKEVSPEAKQCTEAAMDAVIQRQLVCDVPLGTFLSGGIDSPLINAFAIKYKKDIASFTIGSDNKDLDESAYARAYAKHINIKNYHQYYTASELLQQCDEHFKAYSEPFGDFSSLPTFMVSKMAREHFTVMLSGDGGDEIFWGYPRFLRYADHLKWFEKPVFMRRMLAAFERRVRGKRVSYSVSQPTLGDWAMLGLARNIPAEIMNFFPAYKNTEDTLQHYTFNSKGKTKETMLEWLRHNEFYGHLQGILLKVDRASMYYSLEVRVPFLDKEMLHVAGSVQPQLGIAHRHPKYILKEIMKDYFPAAIINEKKMGFSVDVNTWLRNELKKDVLDIFNAEDVYPCNTFSMPALRAYINEYMEGKTHYAWGIWILYALQKWARQFSLI